MTNFQSPPPKQPSQAIASAGFSRSCHHSYSDRHHNRSRISSHPSSINKNLLTSAFQLQPYQYRQLTPFKALEMENPNYIVVCSTCSQCQQQLTPERRVPDEFLPNCCSTMRTFCYACLRKWMIEQLVGPPSMMCECPWCNCQWFRPVFSDWEKAMRMHVVSEIRLSSSDWN